MISFAMRNSFFGAGIKDLIVLLVSLFFHYTGNGRKERVGNAFYKHTNDLAFTGAQAFCHAVWPVAQRLYVLQYPLLHFHADTLFGGLSVQHKRNRCGRNV